MEDNMEQAQVTLQLMLVRFEGIEKEDSFAMAQEIAEDYRRTFPEIARTRVIFQLEGPYSYAMAYDATDDGPAWVENAILAATKKHGGAAEVIHMAATDVTGDI
jgi:hypothetical protein